MRKFRSDCVSIEKHGDVNTFNKNNEDDFAYLELLKDNSPKFFPDYNIEAKILKEQIDSPNVYNVAVVAKYGAGKSSVLNTYLHNYRRQTKEIKKGLSLGAPRKNKYTRITLSTFNGAAYDETSIERSILQQLLYSRTKNDLPNSDIKRTNKIPMWQSVLKAFWYFLFFAMVAMSILAVSNVDVYWNIEWVKFVYIVTATLLFFSMLIYWIHYRKFVKIKYKDFELNINQTDENAISLINKFIDEVLYFFDCTNVDLVIFEDLDRLSTTDIFAKLRELNTIINNTRKKKGKVTFLYAVKDDLFTTEEERAKFFDFILPIVPIINPVTTAEELRKQIDNCTKKNDKMGLQDRFIKGVSAYIPDMRILNNTLNDYVIMYSKIFEDSDVKAGSLSNENLFAISLYKNLFPYDYSFLEQGLGLIPMVVDTEKMKQELLEDLDVKLKETNKILEKINKECLESISELKYMFLGQACHQSRGTYAGDKVTSDDIMDKDFSFIGLNHKKVEHPYYKGYYISISNGEGELLTPSGEHYADREKTIIEKIKNNGDVVRRSIANLQKEKMEIEGYSFAELVDRLGMENCFDDNLQKQYLTSYGLELKSCDDGNDKKINLEKQVDEQIRYLKFLVLNGFIDEHYKEYTSNYKSQLITPQDAQFAADIQIGKQDFAYTPNDIKSVVARLDEEDFKRPAILNKTMLDSIDDIAEIDKREHTQKSDILITYLQNSSDSRVFDAIEQYVILADEMQVEKLLKEIIDKRCTLCSTLISSNKLPEKKKELLVGCVIKYSSDYIAHDCEHQLSNYLVKTVNYMNIFLFAGEDKAINAIRELNLIFDNISKEPLNNRIQQYIIENNRYVLTLENLTIIYGIKDGTQESQKFYSGNFSFIKQSKKQCVLDYIMQNINDYVSTILLEKGITLTEELQENVEELLKNENIELANREAIIKKCIIQITNIAEYDTGLFYTLLAEKKVVPKWENVIFAHSVIGYREKGVENYIVNNEVGGEFICVVDQTGEKALALYVDILKFYQSANKGIRSLLNMIDVSYKLSQLNMAKIVQEQGTDIFDKNLAVAIELGQFVYCSDDLERLILIPHSCEMYIKKNTQQILTDFDAFFDCALPAKFTKYDNNRRNQINNLLGEVMKSDANDSIKEMLIEKCASIIDIGDYAEAYRMFFIKRVRGVPTDILWQFTSVVMDAEDKMLLLQWSVSNIKIPQEKGKYIAYIKSLGEGWNQLYMTYDHIKIPQNECVENLLLALKAQDLLDFRRINRTKQPYYRVTPKFHEAVTAS